MALENKKKFTNVCTYFLEAFSVGIFRSVGLYVRDWEYIYKYMVNSIQLRGGGGRAPLSRDRLRYGCWLAIELIFFFFRIVVDSFRSASLIF